MGERALIYALGAVVLLALVFGAAITFPDWPDAVAADRIKYLGWALCGAMAGLLIYICVIASPYVGSIRVKALGADLDIGDGQAGGDDHG